MAPKSLLGCFKNVLLWSYVSDSIWGINTTNRETQSTFLHIVMLVYFNGASAFLLVLFGEGFHSMLLKYWTKKHTPNWTLTFFQLGPNGQNCFFTFLQLLAQPLRKRKTMEKLWKSFIVSNNFWEQTNFRKLGRGDFLSHN